MTTPTTPTKKTPTTPSDPKLVLPISNLPLPGEQFTAEKKKEKK